jgi:hypothetical protein
MILLPITLMAFMAARLRHTFRMDALRLRGLPCVVEAGK